MAQASSGKPGNSLQRKVSSIVSGATSGALVSLTLQPLDVIRTRLQAQAMGETIVAKNALATANEIWQSGGLGNFWRGSGPTVWRLSVGLSLQFFTLDTLREKLLGGDRTELTATEAFLCGGIARTVAAAATVPFTIAKTRAEYIAPGAATGMRPSTFSALASIFRQDGPRGLVRGVGPTILTNAPFSALYYLFYTRLRKAVDPEGSPGALINFAAGTVAAAAATLLTQPTDVLRTHMQLGAPRPGNPSSLTLFRAVLRQKGLKVLLAGAGPRVLKRTLQTALVWTLYEELQPRLLRAINADKPAG